MDFKSKITWINIIGVVISILSGILGYLTAEQVVYVNITIQVLTIILRQLQGKEINLGGKKISL